MFLIIIIPVYLMVNAYILKRSIDWMMCAANINELTWWMNIYIGVYLIFVFSLLIAFLLPKSPLQIQFKRISNIWLGVLMYILIFVGLGDLIKYTILFTGLIDSGILYRKEIFIINGGIIGGLVIAISIYGVLHATKVKVKSYNIKVKKDINKSGIKIAMIADLHLGYNTNVKQIQKMVEKINKIEPDVVCVAGDFFDNEYEAIPEKEKIIDILKSIESKYGTYACFGNHDIDERLLGGFTVGKKGDKYRSKEMEEFLIKANIKALSDESICINEKFYLVGRLDYEKVGKKDVARKNPEELLMKLNKTKPIIVMDHQPKDMEMLARAGADVGLYGHTHNGQLFPGNILTKMMWDKSYGIKRVDNMTAIVTSGIGCWGPAMRVGTDCEVCEINIRS